jgi:hypothetical protein
MAALASNQPAAINHQSVAAQHRTGLLHGRGNIVVDYQTALNKYRICQFLNYSNRASNRKRAIVSSNGVDNFTNAGISADIRIIKNIAAADATARGNVYSSLASEIREDNIIYRIIDLIQAFTDTGGFLPT